MPPLETQRLRVREFSPTLQDLEAIHRLLDVQLESRLPLAARRRWLEWTVLGYEQLAELRQPPYGDRAIASRETGELLGACGRQPFRVRLLAEIDQHAHAARRELPKGRCASRRAARRRVTVSPLLRAPATGAAQDSRTLTRRPECANTTTNPPPISISPHF